MRKHWRYLVYLVRHKWFVLRAGMRVDVPLWRLLVHDWSKFLPSEWKPYVDSFYGGWKYEERPKSVVDAFDRAWLKHQNRQPHHWQYWVLMEDNPPEGPQHFRALPMPEVFIREMIADWLGAGRAITGRWDVWTWYARNRDNQVLHPYVRQRVDALLAWYRPVFQPGSPMTLGGEE